MPTKIEWTEESWNVITGCTPISEGCQNCYAERMSKRLAGRFGYPADDPFKPGVFHEDKLLEPMEWKKPRKVFVCSMGDLFHDDVLNLATFRVVKIIQETPQHTYIMLTKRPENMKAIFQNMKGMFQSHQVLDYLPNLWIGVTAENQRTADERIPILLQIPAAVRFVSIEPMLGPVDLTNIRFPGDARSSVLQYCDGCEKHNQHPYCGKLDWVICGGETGPGARPMQFEWARSLRNQCVDANVPFFFKGWGNWVAPSQMPLGTYREIEDFGDGIGISDNPLGVGKKRAGRLLDGDEWNEYPEVSQP